MRKTRQLLATTGLKRQQAQTDRSSLMQSLLLIATDVRTATDTATRSAICARAAGPHALGRHALPTTGCNWRWSVLRLRCAHPLAPSISRHKHSEAVTYVQIHVCTCARRRIRACSVRGQAGDQGRHGVESDDAKRALDNRTANSSRRSRQTRQPNLTDAPSSEASSFVHPPTPTCIVQCVSDVGGRLCLQVDNVRSF